MFGIYSFTVVAVYLYITVISSVPSQIEKVQRKR